MVRAHVVCDNFVVRRLPGTFAVLVIGVVVIPPTGCAVRSDEFLCEDAVAKLQSCCPGSPGVSVIRCKYVEGCSSSTYPDIDEDQARCIVNASCSDLTSGDCASSQWSCP